MPPSSGQSDGQWGPLASRGDAAQEVERPGQHHMPLPIDGDVVIAVIKHAHVDGARKVTLQMPCI